MRQKKKLPLETLAPYCFAPADGDQRVAWSSVFGNDHPTEVEVGFGKGLFLVTSAQARPEVNFLGIEVVKALQYYAATRLAIRSLTNARAACIDARRFLQTNVPAGSIHAVHVYFPDPWWKARHKKRRVFTPEFAAAVETALVPSGRLHIATDVEEYFSVMTALVTALPAFEQIESGVVSGPPGPDEILTNFERKARQKGGSVWRAVYQKRLCEPQGD